MDGYSSLVSDTHCKAIHEKVIKIWRALEQLKTGNTSKKLLNEIHQIIYSLY